ncbi:MAG: PTS sugar transporter subunit IIC [Erysipelotrichaceae bacterium]|nr:PTS sugar transporter subunit IIC [Erysipelotrichaceae bacterium]
MKKTNSMIQSINGLAYGYFMTYVLGTLLIMIAQYIHIEIVSTIGSIMQSSMGIGIAIGIGVSLKVQGIDLLCMIISGGIASYFSSYMMVIYMVVLLSVKITQLLDTYLDMWLKPLIVVIVSTLLAYFLNPYINTLMINIGNYFNTQINNDSLIIKIVISIVIAIVMGLFISGPIGGVTICSLMNLNSIACGIVLSGVCSYTIGLAIMGWKDNHIGDTIACIIGTPLLEFSNIMKHPIILIPLILSSGVTSILTGCVFMIQAPTSAGYGLMAFQGLIDTIAYNNSVYMPAILLINIAIPIVVCLVLTHLLYHLKLLKRGDLKIEHL